MTAETQHGDHIRTRPSWACAVCAEPWPCARAKKTLQREFGHFPSVLTIFMATQMYDAFDDLASRGSLPPARLYERFLGWIALPPADASAGATADEVSSINPATPTPRSPSAG